MSLDIKKYNRKPFLVEGFRITNENFEEAARWCGSTHIHRQAIPSKSYFKVDVKNPINDRQTLAYPGDWLLKNANGYKVYTDYAFGHNFELVEEDAFFIGGVTTKTEESVPEEDDHIEAPRSGEVKVFNVFNSGPDIQALVDRAVAPLEQNLKNQRR